MTFRPWRTLGGTNQFLDFLMLTVGRAAAAGQRCQNIAYYPMSRYPASSHRKYHHLSGRMIRKSSLPVQPALPLKSSQLQVHPYEQRLPKCTLSTHFRTRRRGECQPLFRSRSPSAQFMQQSTLFSALNSPTKKEFTERRIMGFSREQMFAIVSDVENYSKFLPWCESSVVTHRERSYIQAKLVIGMKPVTESYTSRVFLRKPSLIIAESNKGTHFKQMVTKWQFFPGLKSVPQSTIVDFYVSLEFRSSLHANIANVFFSEVVQAMAGAFYEEAKRRYGKESVPNRKIAVVKNDDGDKTQF